MSMDFLNKRECHFCGIIIRDENFEEINDIIKEKLGILLMKLTLDKEVQYVTCKVCFAKLFAASNFKTSCLHKNDTITRCVDFKSSRQIFLKQKESKHGYSILKNQEICRLCLQPTYGKHKSMKDVPSETVEIYIPEINFAETTDPAICLKCIDALCIHTTFIQSCLDVEKNRNMNEIELGDTLLSNDNIKTEEIEIKPEETGEDESYFKTTYLDITKADNAERDMEEDKIQYDLNNLDQRTISAQSVDTNCKSKKRKYKTKEIYSSASFKCEHCPFEAKYMSRIKAHVLRHVNPWELKLLQCGKCDFKTKQKYYLTRHEQRHKDPSEMKVYECSICDYKTIDRRGLTSHLWRHKNSSQLQLFCCDQCSYKCICVRTLEAHRSEHSKPPLRESKV